ncbi:bacteriochlorophyll 4-vinyl reductase [Roseospira visakhapatnamensis]|uniref:Divinyl protochlorophyllide a 8-vinyl-reductase n=1 Tax=Roseospira visakhapatnamensis TaxID=390880 RepID=A0A7W6REV6_9PROT|nr:bacteriochlorophyll 4-vinyl reductase [Roseospira visakhapatnamensis]MBB4267188.1 divinyl protochlorophyllide a 8-vinyl-reductase [Roseospira visakhapatnamensis]
MCTESARPGDGRSCDDCAGHADTADTAGAVAATGAGVETARIGPNAIIRVNEALTAVLGADETRAVFEQAGLARYRDTPPGAMVPAGEVTALHRALLARLPAEHRAAINRHAGIATADYLLAVRIPKPAQAILKVLPPVPAARVLITAMGKNSWTFAGGGRFEGTAGRPTRLVIENGPIQQAVDPADRPAPAPVCGYYAATFERLFQVLVTRRAAVRETACQAQGAPACVFEAAW